MDNITTDFWDVLLWSFWVFIWVCAIFVWFRCIFDLFSDRTQSGWAKAGWSVLLIFIPWVGVLIYLIARGPSMTDRQAKAMSEQDEAQRQYIQQVVAGGAAPADQIASAKALLDAGTISPDEFDTLKSKALA